MTERICENCKSHEEHYDSCSFDCCFCMREEPTKPLVYHNESCFHQLSKEHTLLPSETPEPSQCPLFIGIIRKT